MLDRVVAKQLTKVRHKECANVRHVCHAEMRKVVKNSETEAADRVRSDDVSVRRRVTCNIMQMRSGVGSRRRAAADRITKINETGCARRA